RRPPAPPRRLPGRHARAGPRGAAARAGGAGPPLPPPPRRAADRGRLPAPLPRPRPRLAGARAGDLGLEDAGRLEAAVVHGAQAPALSALPQPDPALRRP